MGLYGVFCCNKKRFMPLRHKSRNIIKILDYLSFRYLITAIIMVPLSLVTLIKIHGNAADLPLAGSSQLNISDTLNSATFPCYVLTDNLIKYCTILLYSILTAEISQLKPDLILR